MPTDLSAVDLATLNSTRALMVSALQRQTCLWEQQSADAVTEGHLSSALMFQHWAFASDLLSTIIGTEFTRLTSAVVSAQFPGTAMRSPQEQALDALALEVASAQEIPT